MIDPRRGADRLRRIRLRAADGAHLKIPHVGRCLIEDDVEIGANTTIDRGSIDDTVVGAGTKIDNLVQIAHNVRIGRLCLIMAQVGIAGSVRVEDGAMLLGQVGVSGHHTIGAGARLAAQAGVFGDIPAGETWSGYPARPHKEALRAQAALFKLPSLLRRIERLLDSHDPTQNESSHDRSPGVARRESGCTWAQPCRLSVPSGAERRRASSFGGPISTGRRRSRRSPSTRVLTERHTQLGRGSGVRAHGGARARRRRGLRIDDLEIELDGPEPPIMDGSAAPFVDALARRGRRWSSRARCSTSRCASR